MASVNRGNNGFEDDAEASAGVILLAFRQKASSSALPNAPALPQNAKGPLRRPQGQVCKAENAANMALRLPGGAVSPCLPMLE
jgi:hypothetical protein